MTPDNPKRAYRTDLMLASAMVVAGLATSGLAMGRLVAERPQQLARATQPLHGTPSTTEGTAPAESKPGGERPTTPAPEPARPDVQAQEQGAKAALPPAPAEKTAAPIQTK